MSLQEYCESAVMQTSELMERTFVSGRVTMLIAGISSIHLIKKQEWLLVVIDMRKVGIQCSMIIRIPFNAHFIFE